jgi:uncharacterized repeat protein (TIGR03803 family)
MQASDGKLYGMTAGGGSNGDGVIFSFDPSTSTYTKLKDFGDSTGGSPSGSLIQAKDGKLYGTAGGGSNGYGVIFSFDPSSSTYTKLKDFDGTNGSHPYGSLMQASNGKLYGMTHVGGSSNIGVIFSFDPSTSTYKKLKNLMVPMVPILLAALCRQAMENLYGGAGGGSSDQGVIFSFDPSSSTYTKLKDFDNANGDGYYPVGSLMQASDGKLYGMTQFGGSSGSGVIFSFDPSSSTYTKLKDFASNETGSYVSASLIQARDGKLYGMTSRGGSGGGGVIFSFDPSTSTYSKLKDFDGTNGANPSGSLIQASDGKLYGTANGGSGGYGVIFSFDPSSSTYTKLKDFDYTNGAYPNGSLIQASDGKLYGMTERGGSSEDGFGVMFSFDPSTSTYTKFEGF